MINDNTNNISSFETGIEGWVCLHQSINMMRDSSESIHGNYSLKLEGVLPQNSKIARTCFRNNSLGFTAGKRLSFNIKGYGEICLVIRSGNSKFICSFDGKRLFYHKDNFTYQKFDTTEWKKIDFYPVEPIEDGNELKLVIRSKKYVPISLFIDKVVLR